MAELRRGRSSTDSLPSARRPLALLAVDLHWVTRRSGNRKVNSDMRNLDEVVSDLEWQRLRRRVAGNAAEALFFNCGTWALIAVLKLVAR